METLHHLSQRFGTLCQIYWPYFETFSWTHKKACKLLQLVDGTTFSNVAFMKWFQMLINCCHTFLIMSINPFFNKMGDFMRFIFWNYAKRVWKKFARKKVPFFVKLMSNFIHVFVNFSWSVWSICYCYTISESYDHGGLNAI